MIRDDVIRNARRYLNIQSWHPQTDTHGVFHSSFSRQEVLPPIVHGPLRPRMDYRVVPYVYGRGTILTVTQFRNAVQNRNVCPGGWDLQTGHGTGHFRNIQRNLAGIDCSEYVMKSWGFNTKYINRT